MGWQRISIVSNTLCPRGPLRPNFRGSSFCLEAGDPSRGKEAAEFFL